MNDRKNVTVTPEMWVELYKIVARTLEDMVAWGDAHEQPPAVVVGALLGMAEIMFVGANACDCAECEHVSDLFNDELVSRWHAARPTVN